MAHASNTSPAEALPSLTSEYRDAKLRRRLIVAALVVTALALLHHLDHVIRGEIVVEEGKPHEWNHSGWPFEDAVTVFTASLGVYVILLGGILLTFRRRAWAGYWLGSTIVLLAIVVFVHFLGPDAETPRVVWRTYGGGVGAVLALTDLVALLAALIVLGTQAFLVHRDSGRWRDIESSGR